LALILFYVSFIIVCSKLVLINSKYDLSLLWISCWNVLAILLVRYYQRSAETVITDHVRRLRQNMLGQRFPNFYSLPLLKMFYELHASLHPNKSK
jgi:hypothetical protein